MSSTADRTNDQILLSRLIENDDESATVATFQQLYRESPQLRNWLRDEYAHSSELRERFDKHANTGMSVSRFAALAQDSSAWEQERQRLKAQIASGIYGGLTWNQIMELIYQFQAGAIDPGAVLLVRNWRASGKATASLRWAGQAIVESILPSGHRRALKQLHEALSYVKKYEDKTQRKRVVGYVDWWKLNVLFYMLRNPNDSYRTRDLIGHLSKMGLQISPKEMRRFCARHGIRRDMRAGRPRQKIPQRAA